MAIAPLREGIPAQIHPASEGSFESNGKIKYRSPLGLIFVNRDRRIADYCSDPQTVLAWMTS